MLEFDGQPIDPAIVSAQPMKPAQNMDLPPMVCPPGNWNYELEPNWISTHSNSYWCVQLKAYSGFYCLLKYNTQISSVHPESRLSQPNAVPVQPEPTQVSNVKWDVLMG